MIILKKSEKPASPLLKEESLPKAINNKESTDYAVYQQKHHDLDNRLIKIMLGIMIISMLTTLITSFMIPMMKDAQHTIILIKDGNTSNTSSNNNSNSNN
jgi:hypothetical protein